MSLDIEVNLSHLKHCTCQVFHFLMLCFSILYVAKLESDLQRLEIL